MKTQKNMQLTVLLLEHCDQVKLIDTLVVYADQKRRLITKTTASLLM